MQRPLEWRTLEMILVILSLEMGIIAFRFHVQQGLSVYVCSVNLCADQFQWELIWCQWQDGASQRTCTNFSPQKSRICGSEVFPTQASFCTFFEVRCRGGWNPWWKPHTEKHWKLGNLITSIFWILQSIMWEPHIFRAGHEEPLKIPGPYKSTVMKLIIVNWTNFSTSQPFSRTKKHQSLT